MCLSVREISPEPYMRDIYQIFVDTAAYGRGSVLPRRRWDMLCTSGFADDNIMFFFYNSRCEFHYEGPISLKCTYLP